MSEQKPTMLSYVEETPEQLLKNIEARAELLGILPELLSSAKYQKLWIVACGSSLNAVYCALPYLRAHLSQSIEAIPAASLVVAKRKPSEDTLCLVVSQSGCSTNALDALDQLRGWGADAFGITGNLEGDMKLHVDQLLDWGVGEEKVGFVTKGVTTLALFWILLGLEVAKLQSKLNEDDYEQELSDLRLSAETHRKMQKLTHDFYELHRRELLSLQVHYACGFEASLGVCMEGALKIGETVKVPSIAYEAEEYNHGPNLQLTPEYSLVFIDDLAAGSEHLAKLWEAAKSVSARSYFVTGREDLDDERCLHIPAERPQNPMLLPLYVLPFYQILAYRITSELNRWNSHPLMKDYRKLAPAKTATIESIMPDELSRPSLSAN